MHKLWFLFFSAGLLCSVEAIKNEELPAGFVSWLDEQNPIHEAWQQIANDANIDAQKLYQNPTMDIKGMVCSVIVCAFNFLRTIRYRKTF